MFLGKNGVHLACGLLSSDFVFEVVNGGVKITTSTTMTIQILCTVTSENSYPKTFIFTCKSCNELLMVGGVCW